MLKYLGAKEHNGNFNPNVQFINSNECLCDVNLKKGQYERISKKPLIFGKSITMRNNTLTGVMGMFKGHLLGDSLSTLLKSLLC